MRASHDVAVIGAGPIGCAAAITFARRGAAVLLLEANPRAADRFAGEWIHPSGVRVLEKMGLTTLEATAGCGSCRGFVVHPDDGSDSIVLPYPDGMAAVSFEHCRFVDEMRRKAASMPEIDYVAPAQLHKLAPAPSYRNPKTGTEVRIDAKRIIAADGRRSATRRLLGFRDASIGISFMGGIILRDVDLPVEGYGHVIIGGLGPILLYRIGANRIRMCLDVPAAATRLRRDRQALYAAVAPALSPPIANALAAALAVDKPVWMETRFLPRTEFGSGNIALVGDAAGCVHPLSAVGISLGLMDVETLADSASLAQYARRRRTATRVPELLSNALYEVFSSNRPDAAALRRSVYDTWRMSASERHRTMRMLAGMDVRGTSFAAAFGRIGLKAAAAMIGAQVSEGRWHQIGQTASTFLRWSAWPVAAVVPYCRNPLQRRSARAIAAGV